MITIALGLLFLTSFLLPAYRRPAILIHLLFAICAFAYLIYKKETGFSLNDDPKEIFNLFVVMLSFPAHLVMAVLLSVARGMRAPDGKTREQWLQVFILKYGAGYFIMATAAKVIIMWWNDYEFNLENWDRVSFMYFLLPQKITVFIILVIMYKIIKSQVAKSD